MIRGSGGSRESEIKSKESYKEYGKDTNRSDSPYPPSQLVYTLYPNVITLPILDSPFSFVVIKNMNNKNNLRITRFVIPLICY